MNDENTLRTYGKNRCLYRIQQNVKKRTSSCRLGKPHPRDRRKPLMVFTMPAERIRVDQRAPFLTPRPESLQPQPAVLPAIRRNAFINNDHVDTLVSMILCKLERLNLLESVTTMIRSATSHIRRFKRASSSLCVLTPRSRSIASTPRNSISKW